MLHELHQRFNSPTVNLWMGTRDYLKFVENLSYYLGEELVEIKSDKDYPVANLGDITIYFMHYSSFNEAAEKWYERTKRINWDNLAFIMVQGTDCTKEDIIEFDSLPFKRKVIFTATNMEDIGSAFCIKNSSTDGKSVIDLCRYKNRFTGRRYLDDFDYVSFFNE